MAPSNTLSNSNQTSGSRPSIVYVDDDNDLLNLVQLCFEIFGDANLTTCSDGEKFKKTFEKGNYGILLFDWQMPKLTGIDLAEWVRNVEGDDNATVILVTARNLDGEAETIKRLHIAGVIPKPFDPDQFPSLALALHKKDKS